MRDDSPAMSAVPQQPMLGAALDISAFGQLISAIQQCGLDVNADAIISVRDREFREGHYQRAFDVVEGLYVQINTQAAQRQGELRRQETQYRSGTLKMSPKDWLARQQRETAKTQKIDRARRQCTRILDGLTVLRALKAEEEKAEAKTAEKAEEEKAEAKTAEKAEEEKVEEKTAEKAEEEKVEEKTAEKAENAE